MINFLNLEYFLAAAEELNFTKASKRLYISQQSLSAHIANLEKELDVTLFHRTTPLTLTYAGKTLVKRSHQLLSIKDETIKEIADIKDFSAGELTIGISHTRGRMLLPELLPLYQREFPSIDLNLLEGNSKELDQALIRGSVDIIIGMLPFVVDNIETVPLCSEEILMLIPDQILIDTFGSDHMKVKEQLNEKMDLELLSNCPFLMMKSGNRVRTILDTIFEEAHITPNIILEMENSETLLALCMKGMGITVYPKMFISGNGNLQQLTKKWKLNIFSLNNEKTHGTLAIGYHKGRFLTKATKEFIRMAKENI